MLTVRGACSPLGFRNLLGDLQLEVGKPVHGELMNWAKIRCFSGFDTMAGCAMSSSFFFI